MKSVAIIGAGAVGVTLATLLKDDYNVTLFEKNSKIAKKILASGNGKCNFTNIGDYKDKYNNEFASKIVSKYDNTLIREYFSKLGLVYKVDEENRAYPLSESSATFLDVLKKNLNKTRILLDSRVNRVDYSLDKIDVYYNDKVESFDYVVCCSGSKASNLGSDYAYNYLINNKIKFTELRGSLTSILVNEDLKEIEGVRCKCLVSLYKDNECVYKEKGEVLFKSNALSGIVIFNMSSIINRDYYKNYTLSLDLTEYAYNELNTKDLLGVVHPKMYSYLKNNKIKDIKDLRFKVNKVDDFINSQVVSGGVSLEEINEDLSLKVNPNVYLAGELLDCDGMCGGYNLQFAFSCAFLINDALRNKR